MEFEMTWPSGRKATKEDVLACIGSGWADIVLRLIADLAKLGWDGSVNQVKEKFGGLRFYIGDGSREIHERIDKAEEESFRVCEKCGLPGTRRHAGWVLTLCDDHNNGRERESINWSEE